MIITVVLIAETTSNFTSVLQKHYNTLVVRSGKQGIDTIKENNVDVIVLDAISLKTNGERICKRLRKAFPEQTIIHLHPGKKTIATSLADTLLCHPIPVRALLSSIELLTSTKQMMLLHCGEFVLDLERRILIAQGNEVALTPKQAALVEAFMRHPNETLGRKWLMHHIWNTEYTGDTRTLNVHIRFVRKVMEKNAGKPRFIKTVRGIGYRFEIALNEKADH